jgi:hypothetical protein
MMLKKSPQSAYAGTRCFIVFTVTCLNNFALLDGIRSVWTVKYLEANTSMPPYN